MNRNTRTLIVLLVAILVAGGATYVVYSQLQRIPVRVVEVAHTYVVAAAKPLAPGARVAAADVKLIPWPDGAMVAGTFTKVEDVVDRGVITPLLENEVIAEPKLAPLAAGAGLPPTITPGMRAISVRVNDVIGVAGFVTPGTKVDVFVTLKQQESSLTKIVVSNVTVLTAGTRYDQDKSKNAEAMPSSVVTLLLTPEDAERVVLASTDGQIMLALRNPMDLEPTTTPGTRTAGLFGAVPAAAPAADRPAAARPRPAPVVAPPPPPPPPEPPIYKVEAIRGAKRTEETVR